MEVSTTGSQLVKPSNFQGYDENGLPRSLNGRLTDAHEVCSTASAPASGAAEIACKGRQDFHLEHHGGYMNIHNKNCRGMIIHFQKLVNWFGKNELIPVISNTTFSISTFFEK